MSHATQSIAVLEFRRTKAKKRGPFLVIAPLTTLGHWRREMETWTDMNVVLFSGNKDDRKVIQHHEIYFGDKSIGRKRRNKFDVLLASFETVRDNESFFASFDWDAVVVDEAHRLKSLQSAVRCAASSIAMSYDWLVSAPGLN
jgi:SNF2 family DNA or RNA helicase